MIQGIYSAAAGIINQRTMLDVVTNNLANVNTCGYKRDELSFSGMFNTLSVSSAFASAYTAAPNTPNLDTVSAKFVTDFAQGSLQRTDNVLDLALEGDGFFVVQHADGIRYTRSGNFSLDSSGQLVTADGYPVLGINGVIQIQGDQVEINSTGQVIVDGTPMAALRLADFQDTSGLIKGGNNTFVTAAGASNNTAFFRGMGDFPHAEIPSIAQVRQGFLESSNVNAVYEMVKMIEAMRICESYQKTIQLINETLEKANDELGKVSV